MPTIWILMLTLALLAGHGKANVCPTQLQDLGKNMARGRPAFQSSVYPHKTNPGARRAVDGNCDGIFIHGYCTHTNLDMEPWWYVDLGRPYYIFAVVVKNREDCCGERLTGARVYVGDLTGRASKYNSLCGSITDTNHGSINIIFCNGLQGRYVSIVIFGQRNFLHVCEVEVYSVFPEDKC